MATGLFRTVRDTYSKPLDYSKARGLSASGTTPLVRSRSGLAARGDRNSANYRTATNRSLGLFRSGTEDMDRRYAMSGADDFGRERREMSQAVYDRGMNLLRPDLDSQQNALRTDLENRGIPLTADTYRSKLGHFLDRRARSENDLALGAVAAGAREHSRLADMTRANRQTRFGELTGLFNAERGVADRQFDNEFRTLEGIEGLNRAQEAERGAAFNRSLTARRQDISEMNAKRNEPMRNLREVLALLPKPGNRANYGVQSADLMGMAGSNYAAAQSRRAATTGGLLNLAGQIGSAYLS